MSEKKRILTGVKPTGDLTLGNYIGALSQMVKMQEEYDSYIFVADLHALTIPQNPTELHERIKCRALERHNPNDQFIKLFPDFFEVNQKSLAELDHPHITKIQLKPGEYISDYLNKIV